MSDFTSNPWVISLINYAIENGYEEGRIDHGLIWRWLYNIDPGLLLSLGETLTEETEQEGPSHIFPGSDLILYARSMEQGTPGDLQYSPDELLDWEASFAVAVSLFPMIRAKLMFPARAKQPPSIFELPDNYAWVKTAELERFVEEVSAEDMRDAILREIERQEGA